MTRLILFVYAYQIYAVEFQSYPSMKWKPALFELCVVQQVSAYSFLPLLVSIYLRHSYSCTQQQHEPNG